jgi:hypothetical protein
MQIVVLKVVSISVKTKNYERSMSLEPIGDLLYGVEVPDEYFTMNEDESIVFSLEGIRHIVRKSLVALVLDAKQEDF